MKAINITSDDFKEGFINGYEKAREEELEFLKDLLMKYNSRWLRKAIDDRIGELKRK